MHEDFPVGGIITGGLGLPGCQGFAITTKFHLLCGDVAITTEKGAGFSGGGSKPLAPGEIKDFYRVLPAEQQPYYLTPSDYDPFVTTTRVVVKINFGEKEFERDYVVSSKRARAIIKIMEVVNTTQNKISAIADSLRVLATRASAKIRNLRKKN